jgi:ribosomal-protein-alanine N-acetyltransferase
MLKLKKVPTLQTERLILREFTPEDAIHLQTIANDRKVTYTSAAIAYPYSIEHARHWISCLKNMLLFQNIITFAIEHATTHELIGMVGLTLFPDSNQTDLGYWIGSHYWNKGYVTEAGRKMVEFAFNELEVNAVVANHLVRNPASGRVLQKLGMQFNYRQYEGFRKWSVYEHMDYYILFAKDFRAKII